MQFNITFKTIFEYVLKKLVLCIQIRFVSTEKTTRIASRASCCYCSYYYDGVYGYQSINQLISITTIDILPIYKKTSWTTLVYDILR